MDFPDLSSAPRIGLDTETYDPGLEAGLGPGVRRGGFIAGISVAVPTGESWYFPIAHEGGGNMPREAVLAWAKDQLCRPNQPKVGANLLYDLDYLYHAGVPVTGPFLDVQVAEPLLDEHARSYALGTLAKKYLGESKVEDELYQYCAKHYGGKPTRRAQAGRIWKVPGEVARKYAEGDALLPLRILEIQEAKIAEDGLEEIFSLETRLIPLLLAMRQRGVAVDTEKAVRLADEMRKKEVVLQRELNRVAGREVAYTAAADLGEMFDKMGIDYPRTPKNKLPSITKDFLNALDHPVAGTILELRKINHIIGTFVEGYVLKHEINGRVHTEFHQLRSDDYGTVSGRFSSSNPNLQNIPSRDEELAPLIRGLFVPDPGETWYSDDWSQIEFRLLTHHAIGRGAQQARDKFINDPTTDYHDMTTALVRENTGRDLGRKATKNINFGLVYGMGKKKLTSDLGISWEAGQQLFRTYFDALPFVKETADAASRAASRRGYIRTLMGRHARFPFWEPADWKFSQDVTYMRDREAMLEIVKEARKTNPRIKNGVRRARTHKALNAALQGGAADLMKQAMVMIWEAGICDVEGVGPPLLTVHDELDWSIDLSNPEAVEAHNAAVEIMTNCYDLRIPLKVDSESGPNWGDVK